MTDIRKLYQLQLLDQEISSRTAEQRDLQERLAGSPELIAARERQQEVQNALDLIEREQRSLQDDVDDAVAKLTREEQRLYGGEVRGTRELQGLQQEVDSLQAQRQEREERLLELLVRVEDARTALRDQTAEVRELSGQWDSSKERMEAELAAVNAVLERLGGQRQQLVSGIEPASLSLYETLKAGRGLAVAQIQQNRCQGCRVELPAAIVQRVRQDRQLTQCNHCNRLLYLM
jgi:predicted  nucleic acid-binding Zn-ribbon protein